MVQEDGSGLYLSTLAARSAPESAQGAIFYNALP